MQLHSQQGKISKEGTTSCTSLSPGLRKQTRKAKKILTMATPAESSNLYLDLAQVSRMSQLLTALTPASLALQHKVVRILHFLLFLFLPWMCQKVGVHLQSDFALEGWCKDT